MVLGLSVPRSIAISEAVNIVRVPAGAPPSSTAASLRLSAIFEALFVFDFVLEILQLAVFDVEVSGSLLDGIVTRCLTRIVRDLLVHVVLHVLDVGVNIEAASHHDELHRLQIQVHVDFEVFFQLLEDLLVKYRLLNLAESLVDHLRLFSFFGARRVHYEVFDFTEFRLGQKLKYLVLQILLLDD